MYIFIIYYNNYVGQIIKHPETKVQVQGKNVSFSCVHNSTGTAIFYVNGVPAANSDLWFVYPPSSTSWREHHLIILATEEANGTNISCTVIHSQGSDNKDISSDNATLYVQGQLTAVKNISIEIGDEKAVNISWVPPFTLNISDTDVDITYCVTISNISLVVWKKCEINQTKYMPPTNKLLCENYDVFITPVNGAGMGVASTTTMNPCIGRYFNIIPCIYKKDHSNIIFMN